MKTYLISSQYLEDYETRFKPKGGRNFVVDAPDVLTAVAVVHRFLFTEQHDAVNAYAELRQTLIPSVEIPIIPDYLGSHKYEFENASHAIMEIPEYERDENVRLYFIPVSNS